MARSMAEALGLLWSQTVRTLAIGGPPEGHGEGAVVNSMIWTFQPVGV